MLRMIFKRLTSALIGNPRKWKRHLDRKLLRCDKIVAPREIGRKELLDRPNAGKSWITFLLALCCIDCKPIRFKRQGLEMVVQSFSCGSQSSHPNNLVSIKRSLSSLGLCHPQRNPTGKIQKCESRIDPLQDESWYTTRADYSFGEDRNSLYICTSGWERIYRISGLSSKSNSAGIEHWKIR